MFEGRMFQNGTNCIFGCQRLFFCYNFWLFPFNNLYFFWRQFVMLINQFINFTL